MNSDLTLNMVDATLEDLRKAVKGNGHILPLTVKFKTWVEEDNWIEPGMTALITDVVDFGDGFATQVYLFFGYHEEENFPFFKKDFYTNTFNKEKEKVETTTDALTSGHYSTRTHVLLPKEDKVRKYFKFV